MFDRLLKFLNEYLLESISAEYFAEHYSAVLFSNNDALYKENEKLYDILFDDDFIELFPDYENGNKGDENILRREATRVYLTALKVLPAEQIKQAI